VDDKKKEKKRSTNECKSECANRNVKICSKKQMKEEKQKKGWKKVEKKNKEHRTLKE
jgi:hypothetical protein